MNTTKLMLMPMKKHIKKTWDEPATIPTFGLTLAMNPGNDGKVPKAQAAGARQLNPYENQYILEGLSTQRSSTLGLNRWIKEAIMRPIIGPKNTT